jgi:hypothetical protein
VDVPLPAFDTDERLGMELLIRFGLELEPGHEHPYGTDKGRLGWWSAHVAYAEWGITPNHAICHVLLAMKESGYLAELLASGGGTPWRT